MAFAVDFLIVLVALTGQDDDIVRRGTGDQLGNGLAATSHEGDVIHSHKTGADVVENPLRVFGTRVVVGDQHAVCQPLHHLGHQRTLAAITIATAAEQAQQLALGVRTQGRENFFQRVGGMGVIDHNQWLSPTAQTLHATGRALELRQDLENFVQRVVQAEQSADGRQYVAQVEAAEQGAAQMVLALGRDQGGTHAFVIELRLAYIKVGAGIFQAVGDQPRLALFGGQLPTEFVIEVDDPALQVIPGKQLGLGFTVGLHGAVIIQVIPGQVGQHRDIERQRGHTALVQTMGRDFHRNGLGTSLFQVRQGRLHGNRVRRGVQSAFQRAMEAVAQGPDNAAMLAEQVEGLGHQLGHAGLAVGAGHAHQVQVTARVAIKTPGDVRQLRCQALDGNQRNVGDRQYSSALHFISHGSRATLQGIGNMVATIDTRARHRQEQVPGAYIAAVQGQFANQQIVTGVGKNLVQAQGHQPRPPSVFKGTTGAVLACWVGGRLSGVMFIRRRVPDITLLNTGAETRPPK